MGRNESLQRFCDNISKLEQILSAESRGDLHRRIFVFFHDFRSGGAGGFSNSESVTVTVTVFHLEVRVVHTIKLTVEVSSLAILDL